MFGKKKAPPAPPPPKPAPPPPKPSFVDTMLEKFQDVASDVINIAVIAVIIAFIVAMKK